MRLTRLTGMLAGLVVVGGCSGGSGSGGTSMSVYTSLMLTASSTQAYETGTPTTLTLTPRDQNGRAMAIGSATPTWTVSDPAKVQINGFAIQVQPGATGLITISANLALQGVTYPSNAVHVTVDVAPASGGVVASSTYNVYNMAVNAFAPTTIDIKAIGTVTWSGLTSGTGHNVHFSTTTPFGGGTAASNGVPGSSSTATATFSSPGSYDYACDHHPEMVGTVIVH